MVPENSENAGPRLSGLRCLVVDDTQLNRLAAQKILTFEGARVTLAVDGKQAIQFLRAEPRGFDVVFMDVQMPVMDGLSATRAIRKALGLTDLPVIAWTGEALSEQRQKAREAGCNGILSKPVDLNELVATLILHLDISSGLASSINGA
ncbi:response regulator [Methylocystis sp. FS]|uniref:response regulator n=1 Tax=Methylocystis silviterrae TaxID=2743612 RepID=UPI0015826606|nr:response regulator [Methylocystis silviterrae]NUJ79143.1 response regulator [Methylocystis silviterrae]